MFQFLKIGLPSSKDWFPIKPTRKNRGIMSELLVLWTTVYAIAELHSYNPWCCLEHQATNMSPIFRQERTLSEPGPAASKGSAGAAVVVHSSSSNEGVGSENLGLDLKGGGCVPCFLLREWTKPMGCPNRCFQWLRHWEHFNDAQTLLFRMIQNFQKSCQILICWFCCVVISVKFINDPKNQHLQIVNVRWAVRGSRTPATGRNILETNC